MPGRCFDENISLVFYLKISCFLNGCMLLSRHTIYLIMQWHFRSSDQAKFPIMTQFNTEQIREEAAFGEEESVIKL